MRYSRHFGLTRPWGGICWSRARRSAGLAAFVGLAAILARPAVQAQTLTQALAEAYNNNPQLLAQRALLRATDEQVPQALSFWRPTVNFTGQVGMATASLETNPSAAGGASGAAARAAGITRSIDHALTRPDALTFQLNQPIYRGGRTEAQTRQAINTVEFDSVANPGGRDDRLPGRRPGLSRCSAGPSTR